MPSARSGSPPIIFYGYSAQQVAEWCSVSLATAKAYKDGIRKPSRQALKLFTLYRQELVLGPEWRGFTVRKGTIVDPAGVVTTRPQLEGYQIIMQWAAFVASRDPELQHEFYELLKRA
jgi:hypothetical protein